MDIEGWELQPDSGLLDWLNSGALDRVRQLALELHLPAGSSTDFPALLATLQVSTGVKCSSCCLHAVRAALGELQSKIISCGKQLSMSRCPSVRTSVRPLQKK